MVDMRVFLGFWILFAISGITIVLNTGATFSSITCSTGEVVGNIDQCPECQVDLDCQEDGNIDMVCNEITKKCQPRSCMSVTQCRSEESVCEFNQCLGEEQLLEQRGEEAYS